MFGEGACPTLVAATGVTYYNTAARKASTAAVVFCCIVCSQNASGCSISGSLVSIEMSGKMKANPGSGRIWNLLATYASKK